jgi:hypothetical protein
MPGNLFPLTYKPGIKRDGTKFQSEYCTDGQWIRFQRGIVKKIGGMEGAALSATVHAFTSFGTNISNIFLISSTTDNNIFAYIGANTVIEDPNYTSQVYKFEMTPNFIGVYIRAITPTLGPKTAFMWQFETVIRDGVRNIVCFGADNAANIAQNAAPVLYAGPVQAAVGTQLTAVDGINPLANGGICYSNPYLFIYGSNGYVAYSRPADPLVFTGAGSGSLTISNDKVIFGAAIRGGSNSPSLLFWTLGSVVKVTNVEDVAVNFKIDVISKSSSILSSRCVVEYDGVFFWIGTDRFFVYNGIVQEMPNTMSLNYFFNNIDLNHRQKVFGVKNTKYGEIWWFYPEKGQGAVVQNTRALIYNKRENSWYDTAINRDAGVFFEDLGFMCTFGKPLIDEDEYYYVWRHEVGTNQEYYPRYLGGNTLVYLPIPSSFTTPTFSWSAFNPLKQQTGVDRWVDLQRIEPDFLMDDDADQMTLVVNTKEYAQSANVASAPLIFTRITGKLDMNVQGRHMNFTFSSNKNFEIGYTMMLLGLGDGDA